MAEGREGSAHAAAEGEGGRAAVRPAHAGRGVASRDESIGASLPPARGKGKQPADAGSGCARRGKEAEGGGGGGGGGGGVEARLVPQCAGFESIVLDAVTCAVTLGRSQQDGCRIAHPDVSGAHCTLKFDPRAATLDLVDTSTNGTYVGARILGAARVAEERRRRSARLE